MSERKVETQGIILENLTENRVDIWIEQFLIDRKSRELSDGTILYYKKKLLVFQRFLSSRAIDLVEQITSNELRLFLIWLDENNHNPGGRLAFYRAVKAFLRWWEIEIEPKNWTNPIRKVQAPKVAKEYLEPVSLKDVKALLNVCHKDLLGLRDKAMLLFLLDTGARANEMLSISLVDFHPTFREVLLRETKNNTPRMVFMSQFTRKSIRKYLKSRKDHHPALWINRYGRKLRYGGLRAMLLRRSSEAQIDTPTAHSFRRAFALSALRNGVDLYSLQRLMGHSSIQMLQPYLAQTSEDIRTAHSIGSAVSKEFI